MTLTAGGVTVGRIFHRAGDPNNGDNHIDILISPTLPSGVWEVRLANIGAAAANFDAYIERDDGPPLKLAPESDRKLFHERLSQLAGAERWPNCVMDVDWDVWTGQSQEHVLGEH